MPISLCSSQKVPQLTVLHLDYKALYMINTKNLDPTALITTILCQSVIGVYDVAQCNFNAKYYCASWCTLVQ